MGRWILSKIRMDNYYTFLKPQHSTHPLHILLYSALCTVYCVPNTKLKTYDLQLTINIMLITHHVIPVPISTIYCRRLRFTCYSFIAFRQHVRAYITCKAFKNFFHVSWKSKWVKWISKKKKFGHTKHTPLNTRAVQ